MIFPVCLCGVWVMSGLLARACMRGLLWEAWRRGEDMRQGEGDSAIGWYVVIVGPLVCPVLLAVCLSRRILPRWALPPAERSETADEAIARLEHEIARLDARTPGSCT